MTENVDIKWKEWNARGFIPGPCESELELENRVNFCNNLEKQLSKETQQKLPFEFDDLVAKQVVSEGCLLSQKLFGINPTWVLLFFSNYQLLPWQGGCAWIFQLNENSPTAAFLQLRSKFRTESVLFGLYDRKELIAHELAHVGRMMYEEPQFEELFAYQSSKSPWRRVFGPIVESSKEVLLFLVLLLTSVILSIVNGTEWMLVVPFLMLLGGAIRVWMRHRVYDRCLTQLKKMYPEEIARHLLYRLVDLEIKLFAKLSPSEIQKKMEEWVQESFRWRFLHHLYVVATKHTKEQQEPVC